MYVLKGRIIDGTGKDPIENGLVVVEGNKITEVCKQNEFTIPDKSEIIEIKDGTIMPGFIEQHVHLGIGSVNPQIMFEYTIQERTCQAIYDLQKLIEAGFTSVREPGGFGYLLKEPIAKGLINGTRICSADVITQTGGHFDMYQKYPVEWLKQRASGAGLILADGKEEVRKASRISLRNGSEFLKICTTGGITSQGDINTNSQYSLEEIKTFVEEAEMHDTYVSSHAQGTAGIKNALLGGVKSIEHGIFMDDECIELMIEKGAWVVPTFTICQVYMDFIKLVPKWIVPKIEASYPAHYESIKKCYKAGIKIGLGADLLGDPRVCPYGINGREFEKLTQIGMSPMEAIVAGTKTGAEIIMREHELGTLEPGKLADITICEGNPLENIKILAKVKKIKFVMIDGKIKKHIE
ncbi:MAG: amidohydrolase family protein [Candidatus Hodarchaeota archaeon]